MPVTSCAAQSEDRSPSKLTAANPKVTRWSWSVLVIGRPELIDVPRETQRLARLEVGRGIPGPEFWVRIRPGAITGRRIVA